MYLLLVDNNFISSREIKAMLDKHNIKCEIINLSSSHSLLDIAEKLTPGIVIIDFDFYIDDSAEIVRGLRHYNSEAYILAFIDPDHYDKLHLAIEMGIDDYMVKPLQRDDVMLRIKMGLQRKSIIPVQQVEEKNAHIEKDTMLSELEEVFSRESKSNGSTAALSEKMELKTEPPVYDNFTETETFTDPVQDSSELKSEEDDFETLSSPALSFHEVQGSDETAAEDSDITSDEYDDLEELFGIGPENYNYQTNAIDLKRGLEMEDESQEEEEAEDMLEMPVAEQTPREDEAKSDLFEEKTDEDEETEPLSDFFSEWPDLEEPEESLGEFSAEELAVSDLGNFEKDAAQEKETGAELEFEFDRELDHEMEPEPEMETEIEPELELETILENDPYLNEEVSDATDDKELFGMTDDQRNTDKNTFEEIFSGNNRFEAKKSKLSENEKAVASKGGQSNSFFSKKISGINQFRRIK